MKKIVKRIAAIAVISSTVMSLMASASALTNSETVTNTTKIGTTSYTTKGTNDISTTRYSFVIDLSTYVSSPSSATANEIHTHWQVYDYWTGADIGTKQTEDGYNTNRKDGYDCVSRTYYDDITVLCAHTAYKNGQKKACCRVFWQHARNIVFLGILNSMSIWIFPRFLKLRFQVCR